MVRFHLAQALKAQKPQTAKPWRQVMIFLKEERERRRKDRPEVWTYWQQAAVGNEIGNQLYQEGDYVKALEVYVDPGQNWIPHPAWQLPVKLPSGHHLREIVTSRPMRSWRIAPITQCGTQCLATNAAPGPAGRGGPWRRWRLNFLPISGPGGGLHPPEKPR